MAGSIPPLVSSSPPPLCAFDDDEEEDEDEFGVYAAAEELDYNECISYGGKDGEKQGGNKSRGEQDSTSQDSATDSGLCPDSEGMSPTPHSDDERQRVHLQLPNGHLEPADDATPTESSDFEPTSGLREELANCDLSEAETKASLSAPESEMCNGVTPTVEETLNNHDTNLFKFQDCSSESNVVSTSETEKKSKFESSNLFKNDKDSKASSKNVLLNESDNYRLETFENQDNDSYEDFQEFSTSKTVQKPMSETCVEDEDDSFEDFKECTETENSNIPTKNYPFKLISDNSLSCSSEIQPSEKLELKTQECFQNDANICFGKEELKDTKDESYERDESVQLEDEDDDFSEFTDFKANLSSFNELDGNHSLNDHPKLISEPKVSLDDAEQSLEPPQQEDSEDEFSNFADFSSSSCAFASAQSSNSVESTSYIPSKPCDDADVRTDSEFQDWVSVFPAGSEDCPAPPSALLEAEDPVWVRLVLPEASPALSLQWAACLAHSNLLSSLHIDSRNILWNCGVPRFAATLSRGPLQPVKATETLPLQPTAAPAPQPQPQVQPQPTPSSSASASVTQELVPDAHFDWGSSGLTNPLDYPKPVLNLRKTLSAEAEAILSSLRDLSFIRKNYIVFPINET